MLPPAAVEQQIVVTATRTEATLSEIASSVTLLDKREIAQTPALAIDAVLREAPGFSLFRRSDSRSANPTSQGVSLRGLGASGASRALVLYDGAILSDPFGGWALDRCFTYEVFSARTLGEDGCTVLIRSC